MHAKAKILLVDDHPLVLEWLGNLINQQPDMEVCGEATGTAPAIQLATDRRPDIAVVDISLDQGSGIELTKSLRHLTPATHVIVLSMHDEVLFAERALRAGARGYIMKREATKKVLQAIRIVLGGKLFLSPQIAILMAERFVDGASPGTASPLDRLSDRELEVFQLLGKGRTTRQIAADLHLSVKTVQSFAARIKEKLGLMSMNELLLEAMRHHDSTAQG